MMLSDHADPLGQVGTVDAGGQNVYVNDLATLLGRSGVSVDVFTRLDDPRKPLTETLGRRARVIRVPAGPAAAMHKDQLLSIIGEFTESVLSRAREENLRYDLIQSNYWYSGLVGMALKAAWDIPLVHMNCSFAQMRQVSADPNTGGQLAARHAHERRIAATADMTIVASRSEMDFVRRELGNPVKRVRLIPIGLNESLFRPDARSGRAVRAALNIPPARPVILHVGRPERRKGLSTLVRALPQILSAHPDAILVVVGTSQETIGVAGSFLADVEPILRRIDIRPMLRLVGPVPHESLVGYYNAADVSVFPSEYEPFGIVAIESLACGTPVVASNVGGLLSTVNDGVTGFLTEPNDVRALADAVARVLSSGKEVFDTACVDAVCRNYSWTDIVPRYIELYSEMTNA